MHSATMEEEGDVQIRLRELSDTGDSMNGQDSCLGAVPDTDTYVSDTGNDATMEDVEHPSDERELLEEDESSDDESDTRGGMHWIKSKWYVTRQCLL